ncbi:hypothetical protein NKI56_14410 [Mesorhizobium sp. M0622]|uniref:hypothetical protein n=1 Tax=Mesorhizobium sp. M0622 TaxID=2956975 RepID=UPI003335C5DE
MAIVNELRGHVHQGHALAGIVYVHLRRLRENSLTAKETLRSRTAKADASEAEKGRQGFTKRQRRREDLIALRKRMLATKGPMAARPAYHLRYGVEGYAAGEDGLGRLRQMPRVNEYAMKCLHDCGPRYIRELLAGAFKMWSILEEPSPIHKVRVEHRNADRKSPICGWH